MTTAGSATYDPTTDAGKVRLLCQDFDMANPIFNDDEIQAFLDLNQQEPRLAAAQGLEVIAANETYLQKRIKLLDLWTNGPSESVELRQLAANLRQQYYAGIGDANEDLWDYAETTPNRFAERERLRKQAVRELE